MKAALLLFSLVLLASCRARKEHPESAPTPPASVPTLSAAPTAPSARGALPRSERAPLPVSEDFEESASREISGKNLEQELDKLELDLKEP